MKRYQISALNLETGIRVILFHWVGRSAETGIDRAKREAVEFGFRLADYTATPY